MGKDDVLVDYFAVAYLSEVMRQIFLDLARSVDVEEAQGVYEQLRALVLFPDFAMEVY